MRRTSFVLPALACVLLAVSAAPLQESVEVKLVQLPLTVYPTDGDASRCRGLGPLDFRLELGGVMQPIVALDPDVIIETAEDAARLPASTPLDPATRTTLQLVILFDEYDIAACSRARTACGVPILMSELPQLEYRHRAFILARRMLEESFMPGDRVLLASFTDELRIHSGWIGDRQVALQYVDRLESDPAGFARDNPVERDRPTGSLVIRDVLHEIRWYETDLPILLDSLGRLPGRKDLFLLAGCAAAGFRPDFALDSLAASAQGNHVVLHAVNVAGIRGGINPRGFGSLSRSLGGTAVLGGHTLAEAVTTLHAVSECRYLLSFRPVPGAKSDVRVTSLRPDLDVRAPITYHDPAVKPSPEQRRESTFILPGWQAGYSITGALRLLEPVGKRRPAELVATIERTRVEPDSELPTGVTVHAIAWIGSRVLGEFAHELAGPELERLAIRRRPLRIVFPVDVEKGNVRYLVTVETPGDEGASRRGGMTVGN